LLTLKESNKYAPEFKFAQELLTLTFTHLILENVKTMKKVSDYEW